MNKKLLIILFSTIMLLFVTVMSYGQTVKGKEATKSTTKSTTTSTAKTVVSYGGLTPGKNYLGPSIGLGFINSSPMFGVNYEHALDKNFGIGGIVRYQSYSEDIGYGVSWGYTYMFFGAQVNYHFEDLIKDTKWDPFVGLVLGYNSVSVSSKGTIGNHSASANSGLFFSGHATMRYWLNPDLGIQARLGFGNVETSLEIGVDFKF